MYCNVRRIQQGSGREIIKHSLENNGGGRLAEKRDPNNITIMKTKEKMAESDRDTSIYIHEACSSNYENWINHRTVVIRCLESVVFNLLHYKSNKKQAFLQ